MYEVDISIRKIHIAIHTRTILQVVQNLKNYGQKEKGKRSVEESNLI